MFQQNLLNLLVKYFNEVNTLEKGSALTILSSNHNLKSLRISDLKKLIEGSKIISLAKRPGKKEGLKEETKTINFVFASMDSREQHDNKIKGNAKLYGIKQYI